MLCQWFEVASISGELGFGKIIKGICSLNICYGLLALQKLGVNFFDLLFKSALQSEI